MRVLLDTNIIIYREANRIVFPEIGNLFNWLDRLHYDKYVHPLSIDEIEKHQDKNVVATFKTKIQSYNILKTEAPELPEIQAIRKKYDNNNNDFIDTSLLKEVFGKRIDILITEDKKVHEKAKELGIADKVFKINAFLEKAVAENPALVDYKVLPIKIEHFGNINVQDPFFNSFKTDYLGFENWFNKKSEEPVYVCLADNGSMLAFLYLKVEDKTEDYSKLIPPLLPKRRLKIGTFKVIVNGHKLGERFLKIVFDNALRLKVDEIYVTVFDKTVDQQRLIDLLQEWGFIRYGIKPTETGDEQVFVRDFTPKVDTNDPRLSYPYISNHTKKYIVAIYPEYHTELFPDSILQTESVEKYSQSRPNRNAIRKVYISRAYERGLKKGDVIVFYRTAYNGPAYFTSVATTIGIVQDVKVDIRSEEEFVEQCRKRSVFSDEELSKHWNYNPGNRPFIVSFLYVYSFPTRLNLKSLKELGIIEDAPRAIEQMSDGAFRKLMENSNADQRFIVD